MSGMSVHDTAALAMEDQADDPKLLSDSGVNKNNKCQTCGKEFRRVYDLNRHQKLHTGQKPHGCQRCGKKFSRADALIRHMRPMGSCAQRFSLQTAQAAASASDAGVASSLVLNDNKYSGSLDITPSSMRTQYVPVMSHSPLPSNMRPEEISALLHRVQNLEQQMALIEQRMNRAEHRVNRLEIAKVEHKSDD